MPCSRSRGGCLVQGGLLPGGCLLLGGLSQEGLLLGGPREGGGGGSAPRGDLQAHTKGESWGDQVQAHIQGGIEGDQVQAYTRGEN